MASTITKTESNVTPGKARELRLVKLAWLAHTDGVVTGEATSYRYNGKIVQVVFVPDTGGTAPDDQHDATLTDTNSIDLLYGQGANLSGTQTVVIQSNLGYVVNSTLTLAVTGAGSANGGTAYVYIQEEV